MKQRTATRRLALSVAAAGALALSMLPGGTASAVPAPGTAVGVSGGVNCAPHADHADDVDDAHARRPAPPGARRGPDHSPVSASEALRIDRELQPVQSDLRQAERTGARSDSRIASAVMIPVYAHIIWGKHAGERDFGRKDVHAAIDKLNQGFAGVENNGRYTTRFVFRLYAVDYTTSEWQYHAAPQSSGDRYMKRTHHRGHRWSLNLYFAEPDGGQQALLGWSTFPWEYDKNPRLDGVVIHPETVNGRPYDPALAGFQGGDTTIHEVGHWMGLYHVFQGGCRNLDGVHDTPAQAYPIYRCNFTVRPDTCSGKPGKDAVRNYMGYAYDRCINHFTPGQANRMDAAWLQFRARSTH